MLYETTVNLGNILLSFSEAIDLANESISAHQMRSLSLLWLMAPNCLKMKSRNYLSALYFMTLAH